MNRIFSNTQVERLLSLGMILFGLWLVGWSALGVFGILWNSDDIIFFLDRYKLYLYTIDSLLGFGLILFFRWSVQGIGYFTTTEPRRIRRNWTMLEFAAFPFVLYSLFYMAKSIFAAIIFPIYWYRDSYSSSLGEYISREFPNHFLIAAQSLVFFSWMFALLFLARPIGGWFLKKAGFEMEATTEPQGEFVKREQENE